VRDEEPRSQPDRLVRLAEGLDAADGDEEKSESPYFVAAALVREISSEDEDQQARGIEEHDVPRKAKQDPVPNVSIESVESESEGIQNTMPPQ
jgi:hypothetical protein